MSLAKVAYDAYVSGLAKIPVLRASIDTLSAFDDLPQYLKDSWEAVAQAVATAVESEVKESYDERYR